MARFLFRLLFRVHSLGRPVAAPPTIPATNSACWIRQLGVVHSVRSVKLPLVVAMNLRTIVFAFLEGHPPAARQKGQCACSPAVSLSVSALASLLLPLRCTSASLALRRLHPEDLQAEAVILYAKRQATPVCQSDGLSVVG